MSSRESCDVERNCRFGYRIITTRNRSERSRYKIRLVWYIGLYETLMRI